MEALAPSGGVNLLRNERVVWSVYFGRIHFVEAKCAVPRAVKI